MTKEYTKTNPGCYHSALQYLSEVTGISRTKEIKVKTINGLKQGKRLMYKSYDINVVDKDGNKFAYMQAGKGGPLRFDQAGIVADHFIVTVNKSLSEFGVEIKGEGNYKDSLGGGWHQTVSLFSINGNYFANMDCACG